MALRSRPGGKPVIVNSLNEGPPIDMRDYFREEPTSLRNPPRPMSEDVVQLHQVQNPDNEGNGEWAVYWYPDQVREFYEWKKFHAYCHHQIPLSHDRIEFALDYLANTFVLNINVETDDIWNPALADLKEKEVAHETKERLRILRNSR